MEFSSKAVGGTALGLSIGALGAQALNGGFGNLLGGLTGNNAGCCNGQPVVNRYELGLEQKIAELQSNLALRDSTIFTDGKLLEIYKYFDGKVEGINQRLAEQAVWNATQSANIACQAGQIAQLYGLTKLVVPNASVCPGWTTTTTTTP
jgi:hypothetical protein